MISLLLTTEKSDDLEIQVPDWSRSSDLLVIFGMSFWIGMQN